MKTNDIIYYPTIHSEYLHSEIENLFYDSMMFYSFRHLGFLETISQEHILEALKKSLLVCHLAGVNSKHHFKQIFVFDSTIETLLVDWRMSKTGFNLLILQIPSANEKLASWLWKLADYKAH